MNHKKEPIKMVYLDQKSLISNLDRIGFKEVGVQIFLAETYQETRKLLESGMDLIFMNVDFLGQDTISFCKSIRHENATFSNIPILASSVQSQTRITHKLTDAGVNMIVEQPIPRQDLIAKIKELLSIKTRQHNRYPSQELEKAYVLVAGQSYSLEILDLSMTGLSARSYAALRKGQEVEMSLKIPGKKDKILLTGEVVRLIEPPPSKKKNRFAREYGVHFKALSQKAKKAIIFLIEEKKLEDLSAVYYSSSG